MMKTNNKTAFLFLGALILPGSMILSSCGNRDTGQESPAPPITVRTAPVKEGKIEDYLTLNGKTTCLKKNRIVAPIPAYVTSVHVQYGDIVKKGDVLFELQTRESRALNDHTNILKLSAPAGGTVSEAAVSRPGTYLMEGDLLCTLVENRDMVIEVNVPFEYHSLLKQGNGCRVMLPDQTGFAAAITGILPVVNETDQTQKVLLKADSPIALPENLNLSVRFTMNSHSRSLLVPREAVMCNEKQTEFWLMKIKGDSLAVKVPVERGMNNDSLVEVISPELDPGDPVITVGAYGLPDSSVVKLVK